MNYMSQKALFDGLVTTPEGQAVATVQVGGVAQYVVADGGFRFHHDAEVIDRQVLRQLGEQIAANREAVSEGAMRMIGQEDLFTKAVIDASLNNMDANFDRLIEQGLPENARAYLGMLGFRVVLNYHGEVVRIDQPGIAAPDDDHE
jgi:hypothetical protein